LSSSFWLCIFRLEQQTIPRESGNHHGPLRAITIEDLLLRVRRERGEEYEKDVTCDSEFMLDHMLVIGAAMRDAYSPFVPFEVPLYLGMDNAGGHGRKDVIEEYVQKLKDQHNVIIIHQVPRGPETNILDLGVWMSLQSAIEKHHKKLRTDVNALAATIEAV